MNENCKVKKMQPISKHSLNTRLSDQPPKVKKSVTVISHNRRSGDNYGDVAGNTLIDTKFLHSKNCTTKYTKPELNSTLQLAKRMETLRNTTNVKLTDFNQMTPRTKSIATEKVCTSHTRTTNTIRIFGKLFDSLISLSLSSLIYRRSRN